MPTTVIDAAPLFATRRLLTDADRMTAATRTAVDRIRRLRPALEEMHDAASSAVARLDQAIPYLRDAQCALDSGDMTAMEHARDRLSQHIAHSARPQ